MKKVILSALYNLYLNTPGFPKISNAEYENLNVIACYFLTGPELTQGKVTVPKFLKKKMLEEGKNFNPKRHVFINLPKKPKLLGAPEIVVIELPKDIES